MDEKGLYLLEVEDMLNQKIDYYLQIGGNKNLIPNLSNYKKTQMKM